MTNSAKFTEVAVALPLAAALQRLCPAAGGGAGQWSSKLKTERCHGNKVSSLWSCQAWSLQLSPPWLPAWVSAAAREEGKGARRPLEHVGVAVGL